MRCHSICGHSRSFAVKSGMTLIEVMVAVLLFSFLSLGIMTALRVGMTSMDHANQRLMSNRRAAYAIRILESQLTGFIPEAAMFQLGPQSPIQFMPFFQGERVNMRFISTYSLQDASRGTPQILGIHRHPRREWARRSPGGQRAPLHRTNVLRRLLPGHHARPGCQRPRPPHPTHHDRPRLLRPRRQTGLLPFCFRSPADESAAGALVGSLGPAGTGRSLSA